MSRPNRLLLVLSFVGFIALGLPDAVIGVVWPALRTHFGLHQDALGPLFITVTVGSVMASTASGAILSRLGIGELLAFSAGRCCWWRTSRYAAFRCYSVIDRARVAATSLASNKASSDRSALVPGR